MVKFREYVILLLSANETVKVSSAKRSMKLLFDSKSASNNIMHMDRGASFGCRGKMRPLIKDAFR